MGNYKAVLFDLDDTLVDRDQAVENMFTLLVEKCYRNVEQITKDEMLSRFKELDKLSYGKNDKTVVVENFFDEYPPTERLPRHSIQDFWNTHFPQCFSIDENITKLIKMIKEEVKIGIITNGSTARQQAKIRNTNLHRHFEAILISEEVGIRKPDKRIFDLALDRLNVQPDEALFVGDNLELDIKGSQNANIKGIWFNPQGQKNDTDIIPHREITSLQNLIDLLQL